MNRALRPVLFVIAAIYLAIDELFAIAARPIARWLATQPAFCKARDWISSLRPYPALALFALPLIILEPVKPAAAYLAATGHFAAGAIVFVVGEILKLVLVERLFQLNRDKLISIPAFAWCYVRIRLVWDRLESSLVWRSAKRKMLAIELLLRDFIVQQIAPEHDEVRTTAIGRSRARRERSQRRARAMATAHRQSEAQLQSSTN